MACCQIRAQEGIEVWNIKREGHGWKNGKRQLAMLAILRRSTDQSRRTGPDVQYVEVHGQNEASRTELCQHEGDDGACVQKSEERFRGVKGGADLRKKGQGARRVLRGFQQVDAV